MTSSPKHQVEALLFSSGKAMSIDQIVTLSKLDKAKATRALKALKKDYAERDSSVVIEQDGHEWKMGVRATYLPLVKNIVADTELSKACMETLAVVAYRHPKILQSEVVDIRGGGAYEHLGELEKLGFIRKEKSGRSFSIKLTEKFFDYFEVTGDKGIRTVFKDVQEPEKQQQLGELDVVDVQDEPEKQIVGIHRERKEPHVRPEMDKAHQDFLDDLDKRIDQISDQNDGHDDDPALQRLVPEEESDEETSEEETPEESKDN